MYITTLAASALIEMSFPTTLTALNTATPTAVATTPSNDPLILDFAYVDPAYTIPTTVADIVASSVAVGTNPVNHLPVPTHNNIPDSAIERNARSKASKIRALEAFLAEHMAEQGLGHFLKDVAEYLVDEGDDAVINFENKFDDDDDDDDAEHENQGPRLPYHHLEANGSVPYSVQAAVSSIKAEWSSTHTTPTQTQTRHRHPTKIVETRPGLASLLSPSPTPAPTTMVTMVKRSV